MFRRAGVLVILVVLVLGGLAPVVRISHAQSDAEIKVLSVESARTVVEAWTAAFAETQDISFELVFVDSQDHVLAGIGEADVFLYGDFETLPDVLECGTLSRVYVPLPELGARFVDTTGCEEAGASPEALQSFVEFLVSADGQQVAIDLGLLPDVVEIVDQAGVTVEVPQPVRRIVSGYGVSTYYVYSLGAMQRVVAGAYVGVKGPAVQDVIRRIDPDFDQRFNAVSVIGQKEINIEELAAQQPDLVLASARTQWLDAVGELGIPVLRFEGESPERLKDSMTLIGAILGPNAAYRAAQFNAYYDATLVEILSQTTVIDEPVRVYFSGTEALRTASSEMYQTAMIEAAGGVSVSQELTGFWNDVNLEQVLVWNPDVIFVPTYGGASVEAITESDEWAILPAVQAGSVYQLPKFISPWDTPLPDSILGIIWMAETLYPDQIELGCADQATYFYNTFYDYAISEEEVQGLCG